MGRTASEMDIRSLLNMKRSLAAQGNSGPAQSDPVQEAGLPDVPAFDHSAPAFPEMKDAGKDIGDLGLQLNESPFDGSRSYGPAGRKSSGPPVPYFGQRLGRG
jgi:hypothetical protein